MGNKLGWIIGGALLAALALIVIVIVASGDSATPPTSDTAGFGKLNLKTPGGKPVEETVVMVLPSMPSGGGDAGDDYEAAMAAYRANEMPIRTVCEKFKLVKAGEYKLSPQDQALIQPIADRLHAAAGKKDMSWYLRIRPKSIPGPLYEARPEAGEFQSLADISILTFCQHYAAGQAEFPMAEQAMQDLFAQGWHMMQERARIDLVRNGCGLQRLACEYLAELYTQWSKPERADAVRSYASGLGDVTSPYDAHQQMVIWHFRQNENKETIPPHPGDVTNLAENHQDRCVRVEAILCLGVLKVCIKDGPDAKRTRALIDHYLGSSDPIEREAARIADHMDDAILRKLINPDADKRMFN